ncbi:MAG TPA: glycosyltransferase family 39 protein [bacterium]|nr:glycosyltransferase family 39 protein [bacterium]
MRDWFQLSDNDLTKKVVLLLVAIVALRVSTFGAYPLLDPTEGRYAEIGREMLQTGNWVTPQLHPGLPFLGKPPLSFWATAVFLKFFGINEISVRLASLVFILIMGLFSFLLFKEISGTRVALWGLLILSTTGLVNFIAGGVMTDPSLGATVTAAMVSFAMALRSKSRLKRILWGYGFFISLGLTSLAKGLVGWFLIGIALVLWTAWEKRWKEILRSLPWITGILVMFAIAVPWHLLAEKENPGFLNYYIIGEHFMRFIQPEWEGDRYATPHDMPRGTIVLFAVAAALPWTIVLGACAAHFWKTRQRIKVLLSDPWRSFLVFWALSPLILFTLSSNIMITYVLPGMPAFAMLTAMALQSLMVNSTAHQRPWYLKTQTLLASSAVVPVGFMIIALTILPAQGIGRSQKNIIARFRELTLDTHANLVYTSKIPFSADFYAHDFPVDFSEYSRHEPEKVLMELRDTDLDFFVVKRSHLDDLPPEALRLTQQVGEFGKYTLRRELKPEEMKQVLSASPEIRAVSPTFSVD